MKPTITLPLVLVASLLLSGCNTSPLTIEEHSAPIASRFGTDASELKFVSNGHFTPAEVVSDWYKFTSDSKGVVALTETSLLWRDRFGSTANQDLNISIDSLQGVSYHRGYLQLKFEEQIYVLKPTLGNPFKNTSNHTAQLYELLRNRKVPELALKNPFRPQKDRPVKFERSYHSDYDNASESYHEQTFADKGHVDDGNGNFVLGTITRR